MTREEAIKALIKERKTALHENKQAFDMAIKALEQEPCEGCDYKEWLKGEVEPKTGHWIEKEGFDGDTYYNCSECGESWTTIAGTPWNNGMKYCPNCGAKMESEDKK